MNKSVCSLTDLKIGETARVNKLSLTGSMRRIVQDIGLIEGTEVECVLKSPGGDPIAYQIRGAIIALRNEDSLNILVTV